jgi:hypothetical protein
MKVLKKWDYFSPLVRGFFDKSFKPVPTLKNAFFTKLISYLKVIIT